MQHQPARNAQRTPLRAAGGDVAALRLSALVSRAAKGDQQAFSLLTGDAIVHSAPSALFVASVSAAVSAAATATTPGIAAAATITARSSAEAKAQFESLSLGLATSATTGLLAGILSGFTSINYRARKLLALARDEQERRGIHRYAQVQVAGVVVFIGVLIWAPTALAMTSAFVLWLACGWWLERVYLPRISARRLLLEMAEDPERASRRISQQRRSAQLFISIAVIGGGLPIAWLWWRELSR